MIRNCFVGLQGKVKLVADAVWSKLTGVFVNDVQHVQVRVLSTRRIVTARTTGCMLQPALKQLSKSCQCSICCMTIISFKNACSRRLACGDLKHTYLTTTKSSNACCACPVCMSSDNICDIRA